jgi:spore germination protein GerM
MKIQNKSPVSIPALIGLSLLLIGIAQIAALLALQRAIVPKILEPSPVVELQPAQLSPQLYWLEIVDNHIQLEPRPTTYTAATSSEIALKKAFNDLFKQSPNINLTTTIPQKTHLLNLSLKNQGIYVDLSQEFAQGGGSSSMIYRVAQVLYTATSINPQAQVFLSIAGQPLNEKHPFGGEGLVLEYPLTRQKFTRDFLSSLPSYF